MHLGLGVMLGKCYSESRDVNKMHSSQKINSPKCLFILWTLHSKQNQWAREQVKLRTNSDPLWKHLGLILAQLDGLHAGAAQWAKSKHTEVCECVCVCVGETVRELSQDHFIHLCHLPSLLCPASISVCGPVPEWCRWPAGPGPSSDTSLQLLHGDRGFQDARNGSLHCSHKG